MGEVKTYRRLAALLAVAIGLGVMAFAGPASAADGTTWICKPGQSDDLCAGTISGSSIPAPGETSQPLGYTRPENAPIDCFYLYPTQSEQETPNSNLDKDPPIRRVVVQQARMFSSVCNVYAPMYRQVTYNGNQIVDSPDVEVAYASAKAAFKDYLNNYNDGRPFMMIGHSQGSAHTGRLIDEMVDTNAVLRKRFVGAIAPGANIYVPIGKNVGGMYDNVPACSKVGEYGCLTAFSTFNDVPGPTAIFSRLDFGYYIYPGARPDPDQYEAVCTNPALLDGGTGVLDPLVNFDYLFNVPANETAAPWKSMPDYYQVECKRQGGAHWLNLSKVGLPGDSRPDLGATVASGSNYHVPEVNLAEGNLLKIAQLQTDSYETEQVRIARLEAKLKKLNGNLGKAKKRLSGKEKSVKKLTRALKRTKAAAKRKTLKRKLKAQRNGVSAERKRIKSIKKQITRVKKRIG
jgi:hypothetical protein